jgi:hypothetical protein
MNPCRRRILVGSSQMSIGSRLLLFKAFMRLGDSDPDEDKVGIYCPSVGSIKERASEAPSRLQQTGGAFVANSVNVGDMFHHRSDLVEWVAHRIIDDIHRF